MPRISIERTDGAMTAKATVVPGPPLTVDDVLAVLHAAGVTHGIDEVACARLVALTADPAFQVGGSVLARADPATPGAHGAFEPAFALGVQPGVLRDDGTMDFHDRDLLKPVHASEMIGTLRAPMEGRAGRGVDGREIPPPPVREAAIALGLGVTVEPGGVVRATRSGVVVHVEGRSLDVLDRYDHRGDVGMRSGHLTSEGSLHVGGAVQRQFSVRAAGDVVVERDVECGVVQAGGSVTVRGGILGGDAGSVHAEADVAARHAEGAVIVAGGVLRLHDASSSELAARQIRVDARIRGGAAVAEERVAAREAGTSAGLPTTLTAGEPLERPVLGVRRAVEAARTERIAAKMASARVRDPSGRLKGGKAGRIAATLAADDIARRIERLNRRAELSRTAVIEVSGIAHPGVLVCIGDDRLLLDAPESGVRFVLDRETHRIRRERAFR